MAATWEFSPKLHQLAKDFRLFVLRNDKLIETIANLISDDDWARESSTSA